MFQVLLALLPVACVHVALLGPGLLLQLAIACVVALACEALALRWRGRAAVPALRDGSVLVTAVLLALSVPPLLPWWLTALGTALAVLARQARLRRAGPEPVQSSDGRLRDPAGVVPARDDPLAAAARCRRRTARGGSWPR